MKKVTTAAEAIAEIPAGATMLIGGFMGVGSPERLGQWVEGIVLAGVEHTKLTRRLLTKSRIPVIETFELAKDPLGLNIGLSQEDAACAAVRHLIETGRRRIAFFAGELDPRALSRLAGFPRAMAEAGLDAESAVTQTSQNSSIHHGSTLLAKHLEEGGPAEGIFCIDDNLAIGSMEACRKRGLAVPHDVAIVGFHDLEFAACLSPSLSSVATPRYETGRVAAERPPKRCKRESRTPRNGSISASN